MKKTCILLSAAMLIISASCNEVNNDNNSPSGNSVSTDLKGGKGNHNETDPQNTGGITNAQMGTEPSGSHGTAEPATDTAKVNPVTGHKEQGAAHKSTH